MKIIEIKKFTFIFLFIGLILNVTAQSTEKYNSLLWEISGNGLENKSYLFGTIHIIPEKDFLFTESMKEKFDSCKKLILEIDINLPIAEQFKIAMKMMYPTGKSLKDYMTETEHLELKNYFTDSLKISNTGFSQMQLIQPIFSLSLILNELLNKPIMCEEKLNSYAKNQKMEILGLETMEFQMSVLSKITIEEQVKMVFIEGLKENPLIEYNKLLKAYKSQNLPKIQTLINESSDIKEYEDDLLIKRNKNWIPKIEENIKKESSFIAVGAAHLPGETGLIKLLEIKGYKIKAVN